MEDILPILILGIYILIPLTVSWGYHKIGIRNNVSGTHIVTFLLILIFPQIVWGIRDFINPPKDECGTPEFFGNIVNIIFMVPLTQWLQYVFNKQFDNYKSDQQEEEIDDKVENE